MRRGFYFNFLMGSIFFAQAALACPELGSPIKLSGVGFMGDNADMRVFSNGGARLGFSMTTQVIDATSRKKTNRKDNFSLKWDQDSSTWALVDEKGKVNPVSEGTLVQFSKNEDENGNNLAPFFACAYIIGTTLTIVTIDKNLASDLRDGGCPSDHNAMIRRGLKKVDVFPDSTVSNKDISAFVMEARSRPDLDVPYNRIGTASVSGSTKFISKSVQEVPASEMNFTDSTINYTKSGCGPAKLAQKDQDKVRESAKGSGPKRQH